MPAARARPRPTLLLLLGVLSAAGLLVALMLSRQPSSPAVELPDATPLERDMARWAEQYRAHFSPLVPHADAIDRLQFTRETCNALLVATMNAQRELPAAVDPAVQDFAVEALKHFTASAQSCVRSLGASPTHEDVFERDFYLVLGRSSAAGVNGLLADRYQLAGVPDLDEPYAGSAAAFRMREYLPPR